MEKFGVDVDESLSKEASGDQKKLCPACGAALLPSDDTNVPRCPACGTEPFETP